MILRFFNAAKSIMSTAVCGSMSRFVLLKGDCGKAQHKLVFSFAHEGITDDLMLLFKLPEKMC